MRKTVFCVAVSLLLTGAATHAVALNALTDDQMTQVSGAAGITIAGPVDMLFTVLDPAGTTPAGSVDLSPQNDLNTRYLTIKDGSDSGTAGLTLDVNVTNMRMTLEVTGNLGGTLPAAVLDVYNWTGDVTLSLDRIESRRSGYTDALIFGQTIGPVSLLPNGTNPSLTLKMGVPSGSRKSIAGELGMKLYIAYLDFAGPSNVINNGTAQGEELVFCGNFTDTATKDAYNDGVAWDYDNWAAGGQWLMGELVDGTDPDTVAKPVTLDVCTTGGNTYIIQTIQGNYSRTVTYPDSQLSNMGGAGASSETKNYILGEVRLKNVSAIMRNATNTGWNASASSVGGLALEDLSMEYTKMVITAAGDEPYILPTGFRTFSGGTMPADRTALGSTTEEPTSVSHWTGTASGSGSTRTITWSTTY